MTPLDFLRAVWPDAQHYCLATLFKPADSDNTFFNHKVFASIEEAAAFAEKHQTNVFFCVHTLKEEKVWSPTKRNPKTGEVGGFVSRVQRNMEQARVFFFDLDVGAGEGKYANRRDAFEALIDFCGAHQLPKPLVVSSGGGLHVYWLLEDGIPSHEWVHHAAKLRGLAKGHGLLADPARTTDTASLLRVVGTMNAKPGREPSPVKVVYPGKHIANEEFLRRLDEALIRADIQLVETRPYDPELGRNLDRDDLPPPSFRALLTTCAQIREFVKRRGNVSEPFWHHTLTILRKLKKGDEIAQEFSSGHPTYAPEKVEDKLARAEAAGMGATGCLKLEEVSCAPDLCKSCPFYGAKNGSPYRLARDIDKAPPPSVQIAVGATLVQQIIPDPPPGFNRTADGRVVYSQKNAKGDAQLHTILEHDFFPVRRLVNAGHRVEQHLWCAKLPREEEPKLIEVDADALYDRKKLLYTLSNNGVIPQQKAIEGLQTYMTAYISLLQKETDAEAQINRLGWTDDKTAFNLADRSVHADGTSRPVTLSATAKNSSEALTKRGTLQRQVELLEFYNRDEYIHNQFFILGSLAAPIFHMTGQFGTIVNATGESGASKSSSLSAAASIWGDPVRYVINGTKSGATVNARNARIWTLSNLPVCIDEITQISEEDAKALTLSVSQPGGRIRLDRNGVERNAPEGEKSTIVLTTANSSLHSLISTRNVAGTAGSMRVVEMRFPVLKVNTKADADDFLFDLRENYGHIGEVFIAYVTQNYDAVKAQLRKVMREVDAILSINASERYYSATIASNIVAAEIANQLGLLKYSPQKIKAFAINKLMSELRSVVRYEYTTPSEALSNYLEMINADLLVTRKSTTGDTSPFIIREPRGQMLGQQSSDEKRVYLLKSAFRDYCTKIGSNHLVVIDELYEKRIVLNKQQKKLLGAGTTYAKAQSYCLVVDLAHPELSGTSDLEVVANNPSVQRSEPKAQLSMIDHEEDDQSDAV